MKKTLILAAASVFLVVGCGENQGGGVGEQPPTYDTDQGTAPGNMPEPGTPMPEVTNGAAPATPEGTGTAQPGAPTTGQGGATAPGTTDQGAPTTGQGAPGSPADPGANP